MGINCFPHNKFYKQKTNLKITCKKHAKRQILKTYAFQTRDAKIFAHILFTN